MKKQKLFILDGSAYCYRAYYAVAGLKTSYGKPTGAIYGFVNILNKLIKEDKPDYLAICFDIKGKTIRHKKFEEYKMNRKPAPEELIEQIEEIKNVVKAYNIPIFEQVGYEADDVIATLANALSKEDNLDIYVVTGDKDMLQIVDKNVFIYNPHHKDKTVYDLKLIRERFNATPEQIPDIMALTGDTADNIPGVLGIGEKTAVELISEFKTLENLLKNIDKITSEKRKELLNAHVKEAKLSKELATVHRDLKLEMDLKELKLKTPDYTRLLEIYNKLEFNSLIKGILDKSVSFEDTAAKIITQVKDTQKLLEKLSKSDAFSFDIDFEGQDIISSDISFINFYSQDSGIFQVDIKNKQAGVLKLLKQIFENSKSLKVCYDAKAMDLLLRSIDIKISGTIFDVLIAAYLLNPERTSLSLKELCFEFAKNDFQKNHPVELIFIIKPKLEDALKKEKIWKTFTEVEMPLAAILADMQWRGICVDIDYLETLSGELDKKIESLSADIFKIAGVRFNINSPKQLSEILFGHLKLPVVKRTKTGLSTDEEVLQKLAKLNPLPQILLEYRELTKLKSTYVDSFINIRNKKTGRIHTSFNQTTTATGRLSSSNPNLQNIPIRTEMGKKVRRVFITEKGWSLISSDYSQIELRVLAHVSGDENMSAAFLKDGDIHRHTASLIFKAKEADVTGEMRDTAKRINFGIVYGMGAYGLSKDLNISVEEAGAFIDQYFLRYPKVKIFIDETIKNAKINGYVTTILNRRRYIPDINSSNNNLRGFAERVAVNTPLQGTAADIIKMAMIKINQVLIDKKIEAHLLLQVHDELVFETRNRDVGEISDIIKTEMENIVRLEVPLKVSINSGKNWLEMKEIE